MNEQNTQMSVSEWIQELRATEDADSIRAELTSLPFDQFLKVYEQAIDDFKGKVPSGLINARNDVIRGDVERQLQQNNGHFTINLPFKNLCKSCSGSGERYQFHYICKTSSCPNCNHGRIKVECPKCKGSGRYITTDTDLRINVECHDCNGRGFNLKTCQTCMGSGKIKKFVLDKVKDGTPCNKCNGLGIHIPERTKTLSTPVLTAELATKIKTSDVKE